MKRDMKRQDQRNRVMTSLVLILLVTTCGCTGTRKFALRKKATTERDPVAIRQAAEASEVTPASFETGCVTDRREPGGYLNRGPVLPVVDGVGSPATAVARLRQLTAENGHLTTENDEMKKQLGGLQNDLIESRRAMLATQQECQAARNDLIATCDQLDDWHRTMEKTLGQFQNAEQEHIQELDSTIESVRTVIDQHQKEAGDSAADNSTSSEDATVVRG